MSRLALILLVLVGCEDDLLSGTPASPDRDRTPTVVPDAGVIADGGADGGVPSLPDPAIFDGGFAADAVARDAEGRDAEAPPPVDAGFVDAGAPPPQRECYTEPFDPTVDLSDVEQSFSRRGAFDAILEALRRRYPAGYDLLITEQNDPYTGTFTDGSSFGAAMESSMTEVHEATHGWDYGHSLFYQHFDYYLRDDLTHSLGFNVDGFPRSQIRGMIEDDSTNLYRGTYLTGDQGTRGLLELLDEMNCYINGLGAIAAIADHVPYGISGRDGAVAFLYYLQLYLRRARTTDPQLYGVMQGDAALKEHVKTQWLRAHFFLMFADAEPRVGIRDGDIRANLYAAHNIGEIEMLIGRCVDATNCLCD